jgi:hypothetical protein
MIWYEMEDPNHPLIKMYCPVCRKDCYLGKRAKDELFIEHCDECKATYTWAPNEENPSSQLDVTKKSKKCDCGNCS